MKHSYSVAEASARLRELVKLASEGHEVAITDDGRQIGKIVSTDDDAGLRERIDALVAAGILSPPASGTLPGPDQAVSRPGALDRFLLERG